MSYGAATILFQVAGAASPVMAWKSAETSSASASSQEKSPMSVYCFTVEQL